MDPSEPSKPVPLPQEATLISSNTSGLSDEEVLRRLQKMIDGEDFGEFYFVLDELSGENRSDEFFAKVNKMVKEVDDDALDRMESQFNRGYEYSKCGSCSTGCHCGW